MCQQSIGDFLLSHYSTQTREGSITCFCVRTSLLLSPHSLHHSIVLFLFFPFLSSSSWLSTRESLASNTSSIVESNRRQNLALSPGHLGIGPPFTFRTIPEPPPTTQPEKLQKPSNCLASITSVWQWQEREIKWRGRCWVWMSTAPPPHWGCSSIQTGWHNTHKPVQRLVLHFQSVMQWFWFSFPHLLLGNFWICDTHYYIVTPLLTRLHL